jgi:hypothetical protein
MRNLILMIMLAIAASVANAGEDDKLAVEQSAADDDDAERTAEHSNATTDTTDEAKEAEDDALPNGYRAKVRDGETVYCRKEKVLGTRFPEEFCFNRLQLKEIERRKRSMQDDVARNQRTCSTGSACSGGG